jgi:hypothetical protein
MTAEVKIVSSPTPQTRIFGFIGKSAVFPAERKSFLTKESAAQEGFYVAQAFLGQNVIPIATIQTMNHKSTDFIEVTLKAGTIWTTSFEQILLRQMTKMYIDEKRPVYLDPRKVSLGPDFLKEVNTFLQTSEDSVFETIRGDNGSVQAVGYIQHPTLKLQLAFSGNCATSGTCAVGNTAFTQASIRGAVRRKFPAVVDVDFTNG